MGVMVEAGIVREGTPICVPSKEVSQQISFCSKIYKIPNESLKTFESVIFFQSELSCLKDSDSGFFVSKLFLTCPKQGSDFDSTRD